ncbi:syntaxin-16 [Ischnura elegans]|uniref:syntaxin-16 n=1 Tax=Ischnura elegans TaxID=197161 RepID=UPI001ED86FF2|nr:syntaxin-16 [Ischnura elegans]
MATRNLTEVFILMRNNSLQSRHIYSEQNVSDRMSLVPLRQTSAQSNLLEAGQIEEDCSPPSWANYLEDAHWTLEKVKSKVDQLDKLHREHLNRPSLDDSSEEEKRIESATQEIVRILGGCHNLVMRVRAGGQDGTQKERLLSRNAVSAVAGSLQDVTGTFRRKKATYHEKLASREKRARPNFESVSLADDGILSEASWLNSSKNDSSSISGYNPYLDEDSNEDRNFMLSGHHRQSEQAQLYLLEESAREAEEREKNVHEIARAVVDLHGVFKDLATMVADQGTILDRIDYNVEQCQVSVHEGLKQLQSAANYKKRDRKMMCILMLASMTMLLFIILIIVKS